MKKFLCVCIMAVFALAAIAQESVEHMRFKGVPIEGTLEEFVEKLKQTGLKLVSIDSERATLKGDFAGYSDCIIGVSIYETTKEIGVISVFFPSSEKWSSLETTYNNLKVRLKKKYGNPIKVVEEFQDDRGDLSNQEKYLRLLTDRCNWTSNFEVPEGTVALSIEITSSGLPFVAIGYMDTRNFYNYMYRGVDDL